MNAEPTPHPDDIAVDGFATAMKAKLALKRDQGYGGWDFKPGCTNAHLSKMLRKHVDADDGDPVDVGNFAMMIHQRGETIAPAGEVVITTDPDGYCVMVSRQDREGRILEVLWTAPTPEESKEHRERHDAMARNLPLDFDQKG